MIEFQVTKSPDSDAIGNFLFFFEKFLMGRDSKSQFVIDDREISPGALGFQAGENGLFVKTINQEFFWVNGKKVSGNILLKAGDTFALGESEFKLLQYSHATILKSVNIHEKIDETEETHPEVEPVLRAIEDELLFLESQVDD